MLMEVCTCWLTTVVVSSPMQARCRDESDSQTHRGALWGTSSAVATHPERRGQGIGRQVMMRLQEEIASRWPTALLSTGRATAFYEVLGWQRWRGLSYTQTATGVVPDGEHGGIMILSAGPDVVPDLSVSVTCEDRVGDAW